MHYDPENELLAKSFALVQEKDPDTYAQMVREDWHIATDITEAFPENWREIALDPELPYSSGVTLSDRQITNIPRPQTLIIPSGVILDSMHMEVTPEAYTAEVLVHEFAHIHTTVSNEKEAYAAGANFARRLTEDEGGERMARYIEETAEEVTNPPQHLDWEQLAEEYESHLNDGIF
jgi:hypothetical protein